MRTVNYYMDIYKDIIIQREIDYFKTLLNSNRNVAKYFENNTIAEFNSACEDEAINLYNYLLEVRNVDFDTVDGNIRFLCPKYIFDGDKYSFNRSYIVDYKDIRENKYNNFENIEMHGLEAIKRDDALNLYIPAICTKDIFKLLHTIMNEIWIMWNNSLFNRIMYNSKVSFTKTDYKTFDIQDLTINLQNSFDQISDDMTNVFIKYRDNTCEIQDSCEREIFKTIMKSIYIEMM